MTNIIYPHDKLFKNALSNLQVARDFLQIYLPPWMQKLIDFNALSLQPGSYVDEHLQHLMTDVLYSTSFKGAPGFIYILIEHQSKPDRLMPFRILKYMVQIMMQHMKKTGEEMLPLVYPMVFYNGLEPYHYSKDIFDLFLDPGGLARDIMFKPFQLVDVTQIPDTTLRQQVWSGILSLCMKKIHRQAVDLLLEETIDLMQEIEAQEGSDYIKAILTYCFAVGNISDKVKVRELIRAGFSAKGAIMSLEEFFTEVGREEGLHKGMDLGRQEGRQEGKNESKWMIAKNLLQMGLSFEQIALATMLTVEEIKNGLNN